jgi:hypothetical protein
MKYLYNIIHNTKILQLNIIFTLLNFSCTILKMKSLFFKNNDIDLISLKTYDEALEVFNYILTFYPSHHDIWFKNHILLTS